MNWVTRFKSLPIKTRRLLGLGMVVALVAALPLFIWAIVTQRFLISQRATSGEVVVPLYVWEMFSGDDQLDLTKWGASGSPGFEAVVDNDTLKIDVPQGSDSNGGKDAVVFPYVNSRIPTIVGNFNLIVDLVSLDTTSGFEEVKFAAISAVSVRRVKNGSTETLEAWYGLNNSSWIQITTLTLPPNTGSLSVKLQRMSADRFRIEYKTTGDFLLFLDTSFQGFSNEGSLPVLVAENTGPGFPGTVAYFDNYSFVGEALQSTISPLPSPTARPLAGECQMCGGFAGIQCQPGLTCQYNDRFSYPDQSGVCKGSSTDTCPQPTPAQSCSGQANGTPCQQVICEACVSGQPCPESCRTLQGTCSNGQCITQPTLTPTPYPPNSCGGTCGSNYDCTSGLVCFNGFCRNPACSSDMDCVCGSTPPPTVRPFEILLKLEGVTDDRASYAVMGDDAAKVSVKFLSPNLGYDLGLVTGPIMVDYIGEGKYALHFGIWSTYLPAGNSYSITLKGEKHVAVKFCAPQGQSSHCTGTGYISIPVNPSTQNRFDFTGISLPPGDLYPQDGSATIIGVNSDLGKILLLLAKPPSSLTDQDLLTGDLDYDGVITIRDLFLLKQTLQTRYDEG